MSGSADMVAMLRLEGDAVSLVGATEQAIAANDKLAASAQKAGGGFEAFGQKVTHTYKTATGEVLQFDKIVGEKVEGLVRAGKAWNQWESSALNATKATHGAGQAARDLGKPDIVTGIGKLDKVIDGVAVTSAKTGGAVNSLMGMVTGLGLASVAMGVAQALASKGVEWLTAKFKEQEEQVRDVKAALEVVDELQRDTAVSAQILADGLDKSTAAALRGEDASRRHAVALLDEKKAILEVGMIAAEKRLDAAKSTLAMQQIGPPHPEKGLQRGRDGSLQLDNSQWIADPIQAEANAAQFNFDRISGQYYAAAAKGSGVRYHAATGGPGAHGGMWDELTRDNDESKPSRAQRIPADRLTDAQKTWGEALAAYTKRQRAAEEMRAALDNETASLDRRAIAAAQGELALEQLRVKEAGLTALDRLHISDIDALTGKERERALAVQASAEAAERSAIASEKVSRATLQGQDLDRQIAGMQGYVAAVNAGADAEVEYARAQFVRQELDRLGATATSDQIMLIRAKAEALFALNAAAEGADLDKRQAEELRLLKLTGREREYELRTLEQKKILLAAHNDLTAAEAEILARTISLRDMANEDQARAIGELREAVRQGFIESGRLGFDEVADYAERRIREAVYDALLAKPIDLVINATVNVVGQVVQSIMGNTLASLLPSLGIGGGGGGAAGLAGAGGGAGGLASILGLTNLFGGGLARSAASANFAAPISWGGGIGAAPNFSAPINWGGGIGKGGLPGLGGAGLGSVLGSAGIGSAIASIVGIKGTGNGIADFGLSTLGSYAGTALAATGLGASLGAIGAALGPIGAIAGIALGGLLGGSKTRPNSMATIGVTGGQFAVTDQDTFDGGPAGEISTMAAAIVKAMNTTAGAFGIDMAKLSAYQAGVGHVSGDRDFFALGGAGFYGGSIKNAGYADASANALRGGTDFSKIKDPTQLADAVLRDMVKDAIDAGALVLSAAERALLDSSKDLDEAAAKIGASRGIGKTIDDAIRQFTDPAGFERDQALQAVEDAYQTMKAQVDELVAAGLVDAGKLDQLAQLRDLQIAQVKAQLGPTNDAADDFKTALSDAFLALTDPAAFERKQALDAIEASYQAMKAKAQAMVAQSLLPASVLKELDDLKDLQISDALSKLEKSIDSTASKFWESASSLQAVGSRLDDWWKGLFHSDAAQLNPMEELRQSRALYDAELEKARKGDLDAIRTLPNFIDQLFSDDKAATSSAEARRALFDEVTNAWKGLAAALFTGASPAPGYAPFTVPTSTATAPAINDKAAADALFQSIFRKALKEDTDGVDDSAAVFDGLVSLGAGKSFDETVALLKRIEQLLNQGVTFNTATGLRIAF